MSNPPSIAKSAHPSADKKAFPPFTACPNIWRHKAELKRAGLTYAELAERLNKHGMEETKGSVGAKLARGTFAVTFFLAVIAVLELEGVTLADL